ncbi:MAG: hypothetical protein K2P81_04185 [Bacteriovoracaceae bacterium]|nr:hypothetical protein [Bacteriovoracaceae bacterium]
MKTIVTRMLTTFSLIVLLMVAALIVRLQQWNSEIGYVEWSEAPSLYMGDSKLDKNTQRLTLADDFKNYELEEIKTVSRAVARNEVQSKVRVFPSVKFQNIKKQIHILDEVFSPTEDTVEGESWKQIQGSIETPVFDSIKLEPVKAQKIESANMIALLDLVIFPKEEIVAEASKEVEAVKEIEIKDEVKTTQSKTVEAVEPEFFTYESEAQEVAAVNVPEKNSEKIQPLQKYSLPKDVHLKSETKSVSSQQQVVNQGSGFLAYQYNENKSDKLIAAADIPKFKKPTLHPKKSEPIADESNKNAFVSSHQAQVKFSPLSVSSQTEKLRNFEIRAQDNGFTTLQDNGSGEVNITETTDGSVNSRSFQLLHKDHATTHVDVPMIDGQINLEIPAIEREYLSTFYVQPKRVPLGYVIVELDEETENLTLDGQPYVVNKLNAEFKKTKGEDYRYLLLAGVEVGNRLMTVTKLDGQKSVRIIHVHEEEVTFDANLFGSRGDLVLKLSEEDTLSREKRDLVISGEDVEMTFSGVKASKKAPSTYRLKSGQLLLGARHYITLKHQREEIFLGVDSSTEAVIPSEAFIGEVIRKFGIQGNSQACVVQVNLAKPAKSYEVLAESHAQSHVSYGLVLDKDGQFYESMGEKSRRLLIMSENQGGDKASQNAKLNIRLNYIDGTSKSFSSFCSPNSYLVEQL